MMTLNRVTRRAVQSALDLIFPPRCIECQRAGSWYCEACQAKLPALLPEQPGLPLTELRSTAEYGGTIAEVIKGLKYKGLSSYTDVLARRLSTELKRSGWAPTLITAVPMHSNRLQQRGFNHSELLARSLASLSGVACQPDVVSRVRDTRQQVGLTFVDRQKNVADAFQAETAKVKGASIVLVDDVYTTGATLRACGSALLDAGATRVWALTVARARHAREPQNSDSFDSASQP